MFFRCIFIAVVCCLATVSAQTKVAIAHFQTQTISGSIEFTETSAGLRVTGSIVGLPAGNYGFHVHELGDTSTCDAAGAHFNPDGNTHGGRDHEVRHVGDLGNVMFVGTSGAVATVDFVDNVIALDGRNNILGRTLVLHEEEDDLGLGGDEGSLATGNAGARVACGVIGIKSPADPWNASGSVTPSLILFILASIFVSFSL